MVDEIQLNWDGVLLLHKFPKVDDISIIFKKTVLTLQKDHSIKASQFHSLGVANGDRVKIRK